MTRLPSDQPERERFTREWGVNFAVVANAGSGKTTAISNRLAAMAMSEPGAAMLARTAVVTYTKKAAAQIGQRARSALLRQMAASGSANGDALARLDRVFFGTIHSFCLLLARRHGSTQGIHLNPTLIEEDEESHWQEFLEQDPMAFGSLAPGQVDAFLRHASLDDIFDLARTLDGVAAARLRSAPVAARPPGPDPAALSLIQESVSARKGKSAEALARNKETARKWERRFREEEGPLAIAKPEGTAGGIKELYRRLFSPLKAWLAAAGGAMAAELSLRYRSWRLDRGIQTYADQVETALSIMGDDAMLERIRGEGWRVILDEAQDTDPKQFAVLVEITRSPGAARGDWPGAGGRGPKPGHFCMVGDAQQGIYSARADIKNFQRHVDAFARGDGGERLTFGVTFRAPARVVRLLNATLPEAFGPGRVHNLGLPPADGVEGRCLQVPYETLVEGPANAEGAAWLLPLPPLDADGGRGASDRKLAQEARHLAEFLANGGPAAVGAACWGDVAILAPRTAWLLIVRDQLLSAGLKTALQIRRNRSGDNPAYAWTCGLLSVVCDPENTFEWVGVLREIFSVSDAMIASALGARERFQWDEPGGYPRPIADALETLMPFIDRVDLEGESLERFSSDLSRACGLADKARWVDPEGGIEDELARIHARAAELGLDGAGPRAWLRELLAGVDEHRAYGRPATDALSLLTSHSAKGLEWPVVIPVGMWRTIGSRGPSGLRLIAGPAGQAEVVYDNEGISAETRESHERERLRENVRLLYVTLTRCLRTLVVPWSAEPFEEGSFADLWRVDPLLLDRAPETPRAPLATKAAPPAPETEERSQGVPGAGPGSPAPSFPPRILPHQLAAQADGPRSSLHEASLDQPALAKPGIDPLEYGVWWHQMLEFVPWTASDLEIARYAADALQRAGEKGFGDRAAGEWGRLLESEPWRLMRETRWTRLAEAGIFAPLAPDGWIDGVMDLVLHDPAAGDVWIVDWKTNRRLEGEADGALLARLAAEYARQLSAYGSSAGGFFPGARVRLWVYSTVAGQWIELCAGP